MALHERIRRLLIEKFRVPAEKVHPAATFEELDLDSLDRVEFAIAVEEEFGVPLTDEEAEGLSTLAEVAALLQAKGAAGS